MCRSADGFLGHKVCCVASEQTYTQALVTNDVVQSVSKQLSEFAVPVKYVISHTERNILEMYLCCIYWV